MPSVVSSAVATPATVVTPPSAGGPGTVAGAGGPFLDFMAGFLASLQAGTGETAPTEAAAEIGLPAPLRRRFGAPGPEETLGEAVPPVAPPLGLVPPALLLPLVGEGGPGAAAEPPAGAVPGATGPAVAPPAAPGSETPAATGDAAASAPGRTPPASPVAGPDFAAALAALGLTPPPGDPEPAPPVATAPPNSTVGSDGPQVATPTIPNPTVAATLAASPAVAGPQGATVAPAGGLGTPLPAGVVSASVRTDTPAAKPPAAAPGRSAAPAASPSDEALPTLTAAETEAVLDLEGAPEADAARPVETRRDPAGATGGTAAALTAAPGTAAAGGILAETSAEAGEETREPGLPPIADPTTGSARPAVAAPTESAQPGTPDAPRTAPAEQVAAALSGAQQRGDRRLEIRLDPPELGKVDVRMQIGPEGEIRAHLVVERTETLDMMLRDQRGLERALEQTGVKLAEAGVSFSLRQEGGDGRGDQRTPYGEIRRAEVADAQATGEAIPPASPYGRPARAGGIDLRV